MYDPLKRLAERLENDEGNGNTFTDYEREAFKVGCEALRGVDVVSKYTLSGLGAYRDILNDMVWTHPEEYKCEAGDISIKVKYFNKRVNSEERWVLISMANKMDKEINKYEI